MNEVELLNGIISSGSQIEKIGIVGLLFIICVGLALLLRKTVGDKREVTDKITYIEKMLEADREDRRKQYELDREDRKKLYEKNVEGITTMNNAIIEIKSIVKSQQDTIVAIARLVEKN